MNNTPQYIEVNCYDPETFFYVGKGRAYLCPESFKRGDIVYLIPSDSSESKLPELKKYQKAKFNTESGLFIPVNDYNGMTMYNKITKEPDTVRQSGALPDTHTVEKPEAFDIWDGSKWEYSRETHVNSIIKDIKKHRWALLYFYVDEKDKATCFIDDLEISTSEESVNTLVRLLMAGTEVISFEHLNGDIEMIQNETLQHWLDCINNTEQVSRVIERDLIEDIKNADSNKLKAYNYINEFDSELELALSNDSKKYAYPHKYRAENEKDNTEI